jgi:hypothetical protein
MGIKLGQKVENMLHFITAIKRVDFVFLNIEPLLKPIDKAAFSGNQLTLLISSTASEKVESAVKTATATTLTGFFVMDGWDYGLNIITIATLNPT